MFTRYVKRELNHDDFNFKYTDAIFACILCMYLLKFKICMVAKSVPSCIFVICSVILKIKYHKGNILEKF